MFDYNLTFYDRIGGGGLFVSLYLVFAARCFWQFNRLLDLPL